MKKEIMDCMTWLCNKMSELNIYDWSVDYKQKELKHNFETFYKEFKEKKLIDFENLTVEQAKELHFCKFNEKSDLWLLPLWVLPILPQGIELQTIFGKKFIYNGNINELDTDVRFGCTAYGIVIKTEE